MRAKRSGLMVAIFFTFVMTLGACSGARDEKVNPSSPGEVDGDAAAPSDGHGPVGIDELAASEVPTIEDGSMAEVTEAVAGFSVVTEEEPLEEIESIPAADTAGGIEAPAMEEGSREGVELASALTLDQNSRLTAGDVDDNADWDEYFQYLQAYSGAAVIKVDVSERHQIWVKDSQGNPVLGARIGIEANGQEVSVLRTHSDGRAYFFPRTSPISADTYTVNISANEQTETISIPAGGSQREWFVTLPGAAPPSAFAKLDILFLIDATGSMADEIAQLKDNIFAISTQIDALPSQPDVRFGMVTYRDRDDEFLTNVTEFTPEVSQFAGQLSRVYADGGGDYPEDLNEALSQAIHGPEWRVEETVSLIFLVSDAPPHLDYGQENHYGVEMLQAASRGIKIYPIASSGLDSQGEYIFRQLAQATGGRFIFLTYGAAGPGSSGTETDFDVSDYSVSSLDDLIVKIVEEELSFLP